MTDTTDTAPDLTGAGIVDIEQLLDAWLADSLTEIGDEPQDQEQVDRLLWALRSVRSRREEVKATGRARVELISIWANEQVDALNAREVQLEAILAGWAHGEHERTARKTWKLPAGELQVRQRLQRVELVGRKNDPELVAGVRRVVPSAIKTEESVQAGEVKAVTEPGEVIDDPGVDVPEGYEARQALLAEAAADGGFWAVPGVVLLVPVEGRDGLAFKAVTK